MKKIRKISFLLWLFFLTACSGSLIPKYLPSQPQESRNFKLTRIFSEEKSLATETSPTFKEMYLLIVQYETDSWRWIMTDALGSPKARLLLTLQGWQNDGFIMPNRQAQQLFSHLANALNAPNELFSSAKNWQKKQNQISIQLEDQTHWLIEEIE